MSMPDETPPASPDPTAATTVPAAPIPTPPVADPVAPAPEAPAPTPETPAVESGAPPAAAPAKAKRAPAKQRISDDTLAEWQAALATANAAKQRAARDAQAIRERAEAFKLLRAALNQLEAGGPDDEHDALRNDRLAVAVHQAPEHVRTIIEATLRMIGGTPRRGRRPNR